MGRIWKSHIIKRKYNQTQSTYNGYKRVLGQKSKIEKTPFLQYHHGNGHSITWRSYRAAQNWHKNGQLCKIDLELGSHALQEAKI